MRTSVLINTYNLGACLQACLDSVFAQTCPPDEVIVYDDGSNDQSLDILKRYGSQITVIAGQRFPTPAHVNQARAIHEAFIRSTGNIIFLLDGDDLFVPTRIERYLKAFASESKPVLVQAPLGWINAAGRRMRRMREPFRHAEDPLATAYALQDPDLFYPTSALAFTRDFLRWTLPIDWSDNIPLWIDTRLCLAALLKGPIITLNEELGLRRQHVGSDSARAAQKRTYQLTQTWRRTQVFNRLAQAEDRPVISIWKNRRFYLQLLRFIAPPAVYRWYERRLAQNTPVPSTATAHPW